MSVSFSFTEKVLIGGVSETKVNTITSGMRTVINEAVPIGADQLYALAIDVSQVRGVYFVSDQNVTLEFNSSSAPTPSIALLAGIPYVWYTGKYNALLLTTDITALYITNASAEVANVQIEFLIDPTV